MDFPRRPIATAMSLIGVLLTASLALWAKQFSVAMDSVTDEKLRKMVHVDKGGKPDKNKGQGAVPYLAALDEPPHRIALISFYIWDTGSSNSRVTYQWFRDVPRETGKLDEYGRPEIEWVEIEKTEIVTKRFQITQDGASHFANRLYWQGINELREAFAAQGMQLLVPGEFLDTTEKLNGYRNYAFKPGIGNKFGKHWFDYLAGIGGRGENLTMSAVAPGYRWFATHFAPTDPGTANNLEELRRILDVDAMLIVNNTTASDASRVYFSRIGMIMYGPNPMPRREGVKYIQYKEGQVYATAHLSLGPKHWIAKCNADGLPVEEHYEGYERALEALGGELAAYVVGKVNEEK